MQLKDRVALVTGGTKGIGLGIATAFYREGATVYLAARNETVGREVAAALGENAHFLSCDALDGASLKGVVDAAAAQAGRLDILVNNAGGASEFAPLSEMADEVWERTLSLNLTSAFRTSRAALGHMLPKGFGRIINISSVEGKQGAAGLAAYVAAKHGLNGMTKALSKEVGAAGITVNSICPGLVMTDLIRDQAGAAAEAAGVDIDTFLDGFAKASAIARPVRVEEVAAMAVMLASDAGGGTTGAILSVDGGLASY